MIFSFRKTFKSDLRNRPKKAYFGGGRKASKAIITRRCICHVSITKSMKNRTGKRLQKRPSKEHPEQKYESFTNVARTLTD